MSEQNEDDNWQRKHSARGLLISVATLFVAIFGFFIIIIQQVFSNRQIAFENEVARMSAWTPELRPVSRAAFSFDDGTLRFNLNVENFGKFPVRIDAVLGGIFICNEEAAKRDEIEGYYDKTLDGKHSYIVQPFSSDELHMQMAFRDARSDAVGKDVMVSFTLINRNLLPSSLESFETKGFFLIGEEDWLKQRVPSIPNVHSNFVLWTTAQLTDRGFAPSKNFCPNTARLMGASIFSPLGTAN